MSKSNNGVKEGLIQFLTTSGNLIALNVLWFICCLPLITIGPSTCALFHCTLKIARGEDLSVLKTFFKAFKDNFKQGFIVGAFCVTSLITIAGDIYYAINQTGILQIIYIVVSIVMMAILLIIITYGNGLIVTYENGLKGHIINAFKLAFVSPLHTLLMWIILLAPIAMLLFIQPIVLLYSAGILLLVCFSLPVYICSLVLNIVFIRVNERKKSL